jgi:hypothetical protein
MTCRVSRSATLGGGERDDNGRLGQLAIATVAVVLLPLLVAVVRGIRAGWVPVGDNALIAIRTGDVFSRHPPLLGTNSSISNVLSDEVNNIGPLLFDVLSVPAKLFDSGSGLVSGVTLLNATSVLGIAVFAHRRGGPLFTVAAMAATAALTWGMGSELLVEPWQPHSLMLPFLCFLVMVWSLACGDLIALPWAAGVGSLVLQTHLTYGFLVAALSTWGMCGLVVTLFGRRRCDPGSWSVLRARMWRTGAVATIVLAVCWTQPVLEQLTADGPGNLTLVLRGVDAPQAVLGFERGVRLVASIVALPPWSLQAGDAIRTPPSPGISAIAWVVVAVLLASCAWSARRLGDRTGFYAVVTASVALVAGLATAARTPVSVGLIGTVPVAPHHVRWLWPLASFVLLAIAVNAVGTITREPRRVAVLAAALAGTATMLSATNLVGRDRDASLGPRSMSVARRIFAQMDGLEAMGALLVESPVAYDPYGPAVMRELQRRGVPFVVDVNVSQVGSARRYTGANAQARLTVAVGDDAKNAPRGARLVAAHDGLTSSEQRELDRLRDDIERFAAKGGVRMTARGKQAWTALAANLPGPLLTGEDGAADALRLYRAGVLRLDDQWEQRFERYDELQTRADDETVALFLGPLE